MRLKLLRNNALALLLMACFSAPAISQSTLDGLDRVADWTDLENTLDDMPSSIWGTCDSTSENRVAIRIDLDDGSSGTMSYSGVSGVWNSSNFANIPADTATGFFAACTNLHFLHNSTASLPMAFQSCDTSLANNFDLDYANANGSNFRAESTGWVSARIQTYCGSGAPVAPEPAIAVPTMSVYGLALTCLGLMFVARRRLPRFRKRR